MSAFTGPASSQPRPSSPVLQPLTISLDHVEHSAVSRQQVVAEIHNLKGALEVAMESIAKAKPDWSKVDQLLAQFEGEEQDFPPALPPATFAPASRPPSPGTCPVPVSSPTHSAPAAPSQDPVPSLGVVSPCTVGTSVVVSAIPYADGPFFNIGPSHAFSSRDS